MNTTISFKVNIGDITELKKDKLKELFKETLPKVILMVDKLILSGQEEELIVLPFQVQYSFNHENFDKIRDNILKIQEILLLDESVNNAIVVLADLENIEKDSLVYMKDKLGHLIKDCVGVGKREFFNYKDKLSEIIIEPYLRDNNNIYLEAKYIIDIENLNKLNEVLNEIREDYNSKKEEIISNLK